jgi:hypothetical protein
MAPVRGVRAEDERVGVEPTLVCGFFATEFHPVMAGLDPAIHVFLAAISQDVDARDI